MRQMTGNENAVGGEPAEITPVAPQVPDTGGNSPATEEITRLRARIAWLEANTPPPSLPDTGEEDAYARRAERNYKRGLITSMDQEFNAAAAGGELVELSLDGRPNLVQRRRPARSEGGHTPASELGQAEELAREPEAGLPHTEQRPMPGFVPTTRAGGAPTVILPARIPAQEATPPPAQPATTVLIPPPTGQLAAIRRERLNTRQALFEAECARCLKGRVSVMALNQVVRDFWTATSQGGDPEAVLITLARHCHPSEAEMQWAFPPPT